MLPGSFLGHHQRRQRLSSAKPAHPSAARPPSAPPGPTPPPCTGSPPQSHAAHAHRFPLLILQTPCCSRQLVRRIFGARQPWLLAVAPACLVAAFSGSPAGARGLPGGQRDASAARAGRLSLNLGVFDFVGDSLLPVWLALLWAFARHAEPQPGLERRPWWLSPARRAGRAALPPGRRAPGGRRPATGGNGRPCCCSRRSGAAVMLVVHGFRGDVPAACPPDRLSPVLQRVQQRVQPGFSRRSASGPHSVASSRCP